MIDSGKVFEIYWYEKIYLKKFMRGSDVLNFDMRLYENGCTLFGLRQI